MSPSLSGTSGDLNLSVVRVRLKHEEQTIELAPKSRQRASRQALENANYVLIASEW